MVTYSSSKCHVGTQSLSQGELCKIAIRDSDSKHCHHLWQLARFVSRCANPLIFLCAMWISLSSLIVTLLRGLSQGIYLSVWKSNKTKTTSSRLKARVVMWSWTKTADEENLSHFEWTDASGRRNVFLVASISWTMENSVEGNWRNVAVIN